MGEEKVKVNNVGKYFGSKEVLHNLNLSIKAGKAICLLGHNGSGKSTLLKIIAKLVNPSSGNVVYHDKLKISYVPDRFPKLDMTMHQFIRHMGLIEGMDKENLEVRCSELYSKFFISDFRETKLRNLSKGSLQKVAVIQSILTKPDVLLMDEPISGQDLDSQHACIEIINELKRNGTAIVICCHEKILVDYIADEIYEITNGIMIKKNDQPTISAKYADLHFLVDGTRSVLDEIHSLIKEVTEEKNHIRIKVSQEYVDHVILFLLKKKWSLIEMNMEKKHEIHS